LLSNARRRAGFGTAREVATAGLHPRALESADGVERRRVSVARRLAGARIDLAAVRGKTRLPESRRRA
jgi:hypothetical protein